MFSSKPVDGRTRRHSTARRAVEICGVLLLAIVTGVPLWGWGSTAHTNIIDAALTAIPSEDGLTLRLGSEARHLRDTVQMGDWMNSLIVIHENWHVTTENFPQVTTEYFGNDYLLFPGGARFFRHDLPDVKNTYLPYFFRALQALRTEDRENSVRWTGSLLHFVTDSGSPPHTISLHTNAHQKMENWLDASKIDLRGYKPALLGTDDEAAETALERRMDGLVARNSAIAKQMVPLADVNDRTSLEPMAMDCARETAKVAADVIHTLLVLSARHEGGDNSSIEVSILAPALPEHPAMPAKLVLLGTNYSTLSEAESIGSSIYAGAFLLRNLPAGTYRAAVERQGAKTYFSEPISLRAGQRATFSWSLVQAAVVNNIVPNADLALNWLTAKGPDHWRYDEAHKGWISDNIPVVAGNSYIASVDRPDGSTARVELEWMAQHWLATTDKQVDLGVARPDHPAQIIAPEKAVYVRFVIEGQAPPNISIRQAILIPLGQSSEAGRASAQPH
jgi:hypothetical protein